MRHSLLIGCPILRRFASFFLIACSVSAVQASHAQARYTIIDLGELPGKPVSYATAINASSQVCGFADTLPGYGNNAAFLYLNGVLRDLGSFGSATMANGLNGLGQVVGQSTFRAFLFSDNRLQALTGLPYAGRSNATAINDSGQIVGTMSDGTYDHGFIYASGSGADIGNLGSLSGTTPWAINNAGQVVGVSGRSDVDPIIGITTRQRAFLWKSGSTDGVPGNPQMKELGVLPACDESGAFGINQAGHVVGWSRPAPGGNSGSSRAFLYRAGQMIDISPDGSTNAAAYAVNALDQAVGQALFGNSWHAFIYTAGTAQDLNALVSLDSGWTLEVARGINDAGQIVGSGTNSDGKTHAFLLTPVPVVSQPHLTVYADDSAGFGLLGGTVVMTASEFDYAEAELGVRTETTDILGHPRPLSLWLGVSSLQANNGAHVAPRDHTTVAGILASLGLVAPNVSPAYIGQFTTLHSNVSMSVSMTPKAAVMNILEDLITIVGVALDLPLPSLDRIVELLNDASNIFAVKKAADRFTDPHITSVSGLLLAAAGAAHDLLGMSATEREALLQILGKAFGTNISKSGIGRFLGVAADARELFYTFDDLIVLNLATSGSPMTVQFRTSTVR